MKTLLIVLFLLVISFASKAQIPNASFENWYTYSLGEYPTGWMTSDSVAVALGGTNNVYKGNDPYDGSFSMHLKSVSVGFVNGPGVATNGMVKLVGASFVFTGGTADTTRARFLTGQFKYIPTNANDQGQISVLLSRDSAGVKDTIAAGVSYFTGNVSTYSPFNTTLVYQDYVNNPDTFLIIIQSSRAINDPNLGIGTELIIDSLSFTGTVGIEEADNVFNSVNIFPSPAHARLTIDIDLKKNIELNYTIFDLSGKKVLTAPLKSNTETIDISMLSNGNYIFTLEDRQGSKLYSKNIVVE